MQAGLAGSHVFMQSYKGLDLSSFTGAPAKSLTCGNTGGIKAPCALLPHQHPSAAGATASEAAPGTLHPGASDVRPKVTFLSWHQLHLPLSQPQHPGDSLSASPFMSCVLQLLQ